MKRRQSNDERIIKVPVMDEDEEPARWSDIEDEHRSWDADAEPEEHIPGVGEEK